MGERIGVLPRLLIAFFNTDEIFALAMARPRALTVPFMLGLGTLPILGWTSGTLMGALAGSVLPADIRAALGVMLYGMFIAIVVPTAKKEKATALCVITAIAFNLAFRYIPFLSFVPSGFTMIICAVAASLIFAIVAPIKTDEEAQSNG